jgi:hypothetical protein
MTECDDTIADRLAVLRDSEIDLQTQLDDLADEIATRRDEIADVLGRLIVVRRAIAHLRATERAS